MKKILFVLLIMVITVSCTQNKKNYIVKGTLSDSLYTEGSYVLMTDLMTKEKDTAFVVEGKFTFNGTADKTSLKSVSLILVNNFKQAGWLAANDISKAKRSVRNNVCTFIAEGGKIDINLDTPNQVSGTPLNEILASYFVQQEKIFEKYREQKENLSKQLKEAEFDKAISLVEDSIQIKLDSLFYTTYKSNLDNAIAIATLRGKIYQFETLGELDSVLNMASDFVKNYPPFIEIRKSLECAELTKEGCMFKNFKGETSEGKESNLSDYVGKGKYALVDFWASWCSPCRAEIPTIKEVYNQYSKKGLVVLGVAVWDQKEKSENTIKELQMSWPQIFIDNDRTPTNIYGIMGIPHIILFGPDGTILKRNLRGEELKAAVKEAIDGKLI